MTEDEKRDLRRTDRRADGVPCDYSDLIEPPEPCAYCGYLRFPLPAWAHWSRSGTSFVLDGERYRLESSGHTNEGVPGGRHVRDVVYATRLLDALDEATKKDAAIVFGRAIRRAFVDPRWTEPGCSYGGVVQLSSEEVRSGIPEEPS